VQVSGPVAELLLKWADGEQVEYVEALVRTFQERRRFAPVAAPKLSATAGRPRDVPEHEIMAASSASHPREDPA
jgi:hypothetical protein